MHTLYRIKQRTRQASLAASPPNAPYATHEAAATTATSTAIATATATATTKPRAHTPLVHSRCIERFYTPSHCMGATPALCMMISVAAEMPPACRIFSDISLADSR